MQNLINQQFGRLCVLRLATRRKSRAYWVCVCECGKRKSVRSDSLLDGSIQSCGCYWRERSLLTHLRHGHGRRTIHSSEYHSYFFHRNACRNPKSRSARWYYDKGILFLFDSFEHFLLCVGLRPSREYRMTRIDHDGNFGPGNVQWARRPKKCKQRRK